MTDEKARFIINDFVKETPDWYLALLDDVKEKQCVMCGIIPSNMNDLRNALIQLKATNL